MNFRPGSVSQIFWEARGASDIFQAGLKLQVIAREASHVLPGGFPFYQVTSRFDFLAALRSLNSDNALVIIVLSRSLLRDIDIRAVRLTAVLKKVAFVVISEEDSLNWPDEVEARIVVTIEGLRIDKSPYSNIFKAT